jgi:hypothetical protein
LEEGYSSFLNSLSMSFWKVALYPLRFILASRIVWRLAKTIIEALLLETAVLASHILLKRCWYSDYPYLILPWFIILLSQMSLHETSNFSPIRQQKGEYHSGDFHLSTYRWIQ